MALIKTKSAFYERFKHTFAFLPSIGLMVVLSSLLFSYSEVQRIALIFTGVTYILDYLLNQRWTSFRFQHWNYTFLASVIFFLLFPIWIILGIETGPNLVSYFETYMPFLIIGVVGLLGISKDVHMEQFAIVSLTTICVVIMLICTHIDISLLLKDIHTTGNVFNIQRFAYCASHMQFNLYANMAIVLGLTSLRQNGLHLIWKIILLVEISITSFAIMLSEGRVGIFTCLIILSSSATYYVWKRSKILSITICTVFLCGGIYTISQTIKNHYSTLTEEPRQYIWKVAIQQIKERPILGYGPSNGHEEFFARGISNKDYVEHFYSHLLAQCKDNIEWPQRASHPHNAFLEVTIAYGIIGLLIFLFMLLSPIFLAPSGKRFPLILCSIAFCCQGMFEHIGCDLSPLLFMLILLILYPRLTIN